MRKLFYKDKSVLYYNKIIKRNIRNGGLLVADTFDKQISKVIQQAGEQKVKLEALGDFLCHVDT